MWKNIDGCKICWLHVKLSGYNDVDTGDYIEIVINSDGFQFFNQYNKNKQFKNRKGWEFYNMPLDDTILDFMNTQWDRMLFEYAFEYAVELL